MGVLTVENGEVGILPTSVKHYLTLELARDGIWSRSPSPQRAPTPTAYSPSCTTWSTDGIPKTGDARFTRTAGRSWSLTVSRPGGLVLGLPARAREPELSGHAYGELDLRASRGMELGGRPLAEP
jgi:hypothetical protein